MISRRDGANRRQCLRETADLDQDDVPTLNVAGEYLGHGIDERGTYEGFMVDGEPKYYYVDTKEEVTE